MAWINWKSEDIGIKVKGAPAVSSWKEGRLDVFVCSTDNHLYHRVYENEKWQGITWVDIADGHKIETPPAATSWGPNRVDLFAVWDKQVHHRASINGQWGAWSENLEGATADAPAAASWKVERVDVLVHTTDNFMSRRYWEGGKVFEQGKNWKGWETVGGQMNKLKSAPAAVSSGTGRIDCFAHGPNDRLIYAWYTDGQHQDWTELDLLAIRDAPAAASAPTAEKGRVDVFVRGATDTLKHRVHYHSGWEAGKTWDEISANKIFSAPAAVAWWTGIVLKRLDCFAQDANNNLIHTWWK